MTSLNLFDARPVGATIAIRWSGFNFVYNFIIASTMVVFPVPGPPVKIIADCSKNKRIASFCKSSYSIANVFCKSSNN